MQGASSSTKRKAAVEKHRLIEEQRRLTEQKLLNEMKTLVVDKFGGDRSRYTQATLLGAARQIIQEIDLEHPNEPFWPSFLTTSDRQLLHFEASTACIFVATLDSSAFPIVYVSDSLDRVLHWRPDQWIRQSLLAFIHPEDAPRVQYLLTLSCQQVHQNVSINCRLQQGDGSYVPVVIDGMVKKLDRTMTPVSVNEDGYLAFVGVCSVPSPSTCSPHDTPPRVTSDSPILTCRCSPNDWKIFLVDSSRTTIPTQHVGSFRNQSILAFIDISDQAAFQQTLMDATSTARDQTRICRFVHPSIGGLMVLVNVIPVVNPGRQQTDFLELSFAQIDQLLQGLMETDSSSPLAYESTQ